MSAHLAIVAVSIFAGLSHIRARGSRGVLESIRQRTRSHKLVGVLHEDPVDAFLAVAVDALGDDVALADFLDVEVDDGQISNKIWFVWRSMGVRRGPILIIHHLYVYPEERGAGRGAEVVRRMTTEARKRGAGAILIQAADIDGEEPRHPRGFWERVGFRVWPGDYPTWFGGDRFMVKVLDGQGGGDGGR